MTMECDHHSQEKKNFNKHKEVELIQLPLVTYNVKFNDTFVAEVSLIGAIEQIMYPTIQQYKCQIIFMFIIKSVQVQFPL